MENNLCLQFYVLMRGVLSRLHLTIIEKYLKDIGSVVSVHDLHIWTDLART